MSLAIPSETSLGILPLSRQLEDFASNAAISALFMAESYTRTDEALVALSFPASLEARFSARRLGACCRGG